MQQLALRWALFLFVTLSAGLSEVNGQVFFLRDTFCSNQLLLVNGHLYGPDTPEGTEIIPGGAVNGADSIIEVRLVFYQPALTQILQPICDGDTLWVNNVAYHAGFNIGEELIEGGAANGCDSVIQINLTVYYESVHLIDQIICAGDSLLVNGEAYDAFHPSGTEIIPGGASNGYCDSIIQINLTPITESYTALNDTLCPDSALIINGNRYDKFHPFGQEVLVGSSSHGCDSIVDIDLTFRDLWVDLGEDQEVSIGDSICIASTLNFSPISLEWAPTLPCQDLSCLAVCQVYFADSYLVFSATDSSGCIISDEVLIKASSAPPIYAPTVFNPDVAWPNNHFYLSAGAGISRILNFRIANRWGELFLEQENIAPGVPEDGWNGYWRGKIAPAGVYIFWAEIAFWDGSTEVVSGSFTLLR